MDLILPLDWKNWLLLISALINLAMAIFIFSRGVKKSKINLYFSLLTFFCFTWAIGLFLARSTSDLFLTSVFARSTYISALCIGLSLLYFTIFFPYFYSNLRKFIIGLIWLLFFILGGLVYSSLFITSFVFAYGPGEYISFFNPYGFFVYAIYFVLITMLSLLNLFKKYKNSDNLFRNSLLFLFLTILIGLVFGVYFDLFLLFFGNFRFVWFGPVFTIFMNIFVFYLVFSKKDKKLSY